jgi:nitrogen-specific signal transduction histidine kinase
MDAHSFDSPLSHFDAAAMLDVLNVPLVVLDGEGCAVYANAAALVLLRVRAQDLKGRPLDQLFAMGPALRQWLTALLRGVDRGGPRRATVLELTLPGVRLRLKAAVVEAGITGPHLVVQLGRVRPVRVTPVLLECA